MYLLGTTFSGKLGSPVSIYSSRMVYVGLKSKLTTVPIFIVIREIVWLTDVFLMIM